MFLLALLLVLHTGTFVLLYYVTSYYIFRGGSSVNGDLCGILFLYTGNIASNAGWNIGDVLSLLHIILFVVVLVHMVTIVVYSILVLTLLLLLMFLELVLLYHLYNLTKYY